MFKIVQTVEAGHKVPLLSIVPSAWEQDHVLYWPNTKKPALLEQLLKNPNSKPQEGWLEQQCLKKRENFLTYQAAEIELEAMTNQSDTDAEWTETNKRKRTQRAKADADFNSLMDVENCQESIKVGITYIN